MIAALDLALDVAVLEDHVAVRVRDGLALALGDRDGLAVVARADGSAVVAERTDAGQIEDQREDRESGDGEPGSQGRTPRETALTTGSASVREEPFLQEHDEVVVRLRPGRAQPRLHFWV